MRKSLVVALACLLIAPLSAPAAQSRRRKPSASSRRSTASRTEATTSFDRRDGAERVAGQIRRLTQFLYLLGGIAKGLDATDEAVRSGASSPEIAAAIQRNKDSIRGSIRDVQAGLAQLEDDFSTKPALRPYYHNLLGIADAGAQASQFADANQFDQAGRALLKAVGRLTDTLLAMGQGEGAQ